MTPLRGRRIPSEHEREKRLRALEDALAESWLDPLGLARVAERFTELLPGTAGFAYTRELDGSLGPIGHTVTGKLEDSWSSMPRPQSDTDIERTLGYPICGTYAFEGRFVNTDITYGDRRDELAQYQEDMLGPNGVRNHLRAVFYVGGRMRAWYGLFGDRADHEFTVDESALLERAIPALRDAVRMGHVTRFGRAKPEVVQTILEAIERPTWIFGPRGFVVHANAMARALDKDERARAARAAGSREASALYSVSRVSIENEPLAVVVGRAAPAEPTLPPSLSRIADRISHGMSDKQIATELSIPLATVRTYVQRIYTRLGVHNRVELAMRLRERARH